MREEPPFGVTMDSGHPIKGTTAPPSTPAGQPADDDTADVVARVNVALIRDTAEALERLRARTGMKKVDLVNRAIQIYEFLDAEQRAGNSIALYAEDGTGSAGEVPVNAPMMRARLHGNPCRVAGHGSHCERVDERQPITRRSSSGRQPFERR